MGATIEELMVIGRLNRTANDDTRYNVRSSTTSGFGTLGKIINERFERRILAGISQFKAIVYKVVSHGAQDPARTPQRSPNANQQNITGQDTPNSVIIRACIPEVHGHLPIPSRLPKKNGDIDRANADIIDMYPEFTSRASDTTKPPVPGEIVWVTFENLETFTGGIYIGKINNEAEEIKVKFPKKVANKFKEKCRFCTLAPKGEDLAMARHEIDWKSSQLFWNENIDVSTALGTIPLGKGLFAESVNTKKYKPEKARQSQISWVALQIKNKNLNIKSIKKAIKAYHKNGIRVYLHANPERGKNEEFLKTITSLLAGDREKKGDKYIFTGIPIGFLIDFTDYLSGAPNTAATIAPAAALWISLHNTLKSYGLSIGFTMKDIKDSNDRVRIGLPYSAFATGDHQADFSVIQWEWITALAHNTPEDKEAAISKRFGAFEQAYTIFRALDFKNIIPALSANRFYVTDPAMEATGKEMRIDALKMFAGHPAGTAPIIEEQANAVIWDDWSGAAATKKGGWSEKRWEILEEFGNLTRRAEKLNALDEDTSADVSQKFFIQQNGLEGLMTGLVAEFDDFTNIKRAKNGRTIWKDNVFLPRGSARPLQVKEAFPELLFYRNYKEEYYDAMFSMFANPPSNLNIKSPGNINPAIFTVAHYNNMSPKKQKDLMILGYIFASQNPDAVIKQETELISDASIRAMEIEKAQGKTIYEVCEDSEAGG